MSGATYERDLQSGTAWYGVNQRQVPEDRDNRRPQRWRNGSSTETPADAKRR